MIKRKMPERNDEEHYDRKYKINFNIRTYLEKERKRTNKNIVRL